MSKKYIAFFEKRKQVEHIEYEGKVDDLRLVLASVFCQDVICIEEAESKNLVYFKDRDRGDVYESVYEYIMALMPEELAEEVAKELSVIASKDNISVLNKFERRYVKISPIEIRQLVLRTLRNDYQFSAKFIDHFVCRLLCRFRNDPIDFVMRRVKEAYAKRKKDTEKKEELLTGSDLRIIYNRERKEIITIFMPRFLEGSRRRIR